MAHDYKFNKIQFINVEGAWSLHLLSHYNKEFKEDDKVGLIHDLKKIVEGSLYRSVKDKLVRTRITFQPSCGLERLSSEHFENFKSNWIKGRKCEVIIIEHYGDPADYAQYFENKTIITVPYTKYSTSKGSLIRSRILNGDNTLINYNIVTKIDKTLDVIDYDSPQQPSSATINQIR